MNLQNIHSPNIINININNDLQQIPLHSYSTMGPLLTNDLSENLDFSDMPDLESVPIDSVPLIPLDSDSDDSLPPVFICEYQAKEKALELQKPNKSLDEIKQNIEKTFNFNDISEGMEALNNPDILMNRLQQAYDSFKSQAGRPMTYLEMREMMG
jgi:hypothetical protein